MKPIYNLIRYQGAIFGVDGASNPVDCMQILYCLHRPNGIDVDRLITCTKRLSAQITRALSLLYADLSFLIAMNCSFLCQKMQLQ